MPASHEPRWCRNGAVAAEIAVPAGAMPSRGPSTPIRSLDRAQRALERNVSRTKAVRSSQGDASKLATQSVGTLEAPSLTRFRASPTLKVCEGAEKLNAPSDSSSLEPKVMVDGDANFREVEEPLTHGIGQPRADQHQKKR